MDEKIRIGLELHLSFPQEKKLFCPCSQSSTCGICLGLPGTKPLFQEQTFLELTKILSLFEKPFEKSFFRVYRKHYSYPDLPKGYQLTSEPEPLISDVFFYFEKESYHIKQIHIEENPAKQIRSKTNKIEQVDYSRSGIGLLEVVTEIFFTIDKTLSFLENFLFCVEELFRKPVSWKADVNISIYPFERTEVKNISSFKDILSTISYEIKRQLILIKKNCKPELYTREFNKITKKTENRRVKEKKEDYFFIREPELDSIEVKDLKQAPFQKKAQNLASFVPFKTSVYLAKTSFSLFDFILNNRDILKQKPKLIFCIAGKWKRYIEKNLPLQQKILSAYPYLTKESFLALLPLFEHQNKKKLSEKEFVRLLEDELKQNKKLNFIIGSLKKDYLLPENFKKYLTVL